MLVVAELNGSGNQISEGSVTDVLNKPTIIHTDDDQLKDMITKRGVMTNERT